MKRIVLLLLVTFFSLESIKAQTSTRKDSLKILLQKEKLDTSRVRLLLQLSGLYVTNKPDTAMFLALEALSLSQRIGSVKGEGGSLTRIGQAYRAAGNLPKALELFLKVLKLAETNNNPTAIAGSLHDIGTIYNAQGEYRQAIDYLLKAKELNEQLNNKRGILVNLLRIGHSYLGLKQYDSAMVHAQQGYELAKKLDTPFEGMTLSLMGDISSKTGQNKLALEYYRLSIPHFKKREINKELGDAFLSMAKLFEHEEQTDSALFYANKAFQINRTAGFTVGVRDVGSFLSTYYENRGNSDSAFFYIKTASTASDSLSSQERINQFQSLSFDEKLRQLEIAEQRKHNLQFAAIAIGLIAFILLFFLLSRSIVVKTRFIEFFGVLGLLAVFEFINLILHPYLAHLTHDSPVLMLGILIAIGALLVPLHHKLEQWMTKVMVEKNKKIRLEAARKTIANLESAFAEATAGKTDQSN